MSLFNLAHEEDSDKNAENKNGACDIIEKIRHHFLPPFSFDLNILSIRPVTPKPPTTFTIARIRASEPKIYPITGSSALTAITVDEIAPRTVTPESAFMPDISGVWSRLGTLLISL